MKKQIKTVKGVLLLDSVFALLVTTLTCASIIYLQQDILMQSHKEETSLYQQANNNLINNIRNNQFQVITLQTNNKYTYQFKVFEGTYSYITLRNLEIIP